MQPLINRQAASRLAGLELNALVAAGAIPAAPFEGARIAASGTPIHDLNGEILFYRVPVRGGSVDAFVDIAGYAGFGDTLLRVSHGMTWDEKALIASAAAAARKRQRGLRYDKARFVAYSYPKVAVQFLAGGEEVIMIELGSWSPVPKPKRRKADEPPGNFERWSFIEEQPANTLRSREKRIIERLRQWEEIAPAKKLRRGFDPRIVATDTFRRAFEPALLIRTETRQVAYSPRAGDHVPCFELRGQQTNVWCVAGSVQMILDFYRYNYDQTRIAADLGLGTLANPNGLPYSQDNQVVVVLEALTSNALDASMNTSPSWNEFRDEVRANRPLISFVPGHSRCVAGYTSTRIFSWYLFRGLLVYDPWPPTTGVITQWENFDATTYRRTFTAQVSLI
jgi:hypothetical protein